MKNHGKLSRRDFIKAAALGAGSLALVGGCGTPHPDEEGPLSNEEVALLGAVAEQIIPTDEWPGGRDAGVVNFLSTQLAGPYRRFQQDYHKGLAGITATCLRLHQHRFEAMSAEQQMSFLQDMESGKLDEGEWKGGFGRKFFDLLRTHCLQGYYGSPRHGGNKNYVSYKMIGLDYPMVVGQNRYRSGQ